MLPGVNVWQVAWLPPPHWGPISIENPVLRAYECEFYMGKTYICGKRTILSFNRLKTLQKQPRQFYCRFLIKNWHWRPLDMLELIIFSSFPVFTAPWTEPVFFISHTRASLFCFMGTSSTANLFNFWLSCGFMIHWCHFEGKAWLTSARSMSILSASHYFYTNC